MLHRRRVIAATIVALLVAQTAAFGSDKTAPAEPVVALALTVAVDVLAEPRVVDWPAPVAEGPVANPVLSVRGTAYNSMVSQTNDQPFVTATGQRTGWGIVAVSRDLLGADLPYGTLVRLRDLGNFHNGRGAGAYQDLLDDTTFVVEDTMHPRKRNQIDVWFADHASALAWGVRRIEVEVVRHGRDGPTLEPPEDEPPFDASVTWIASR
jgi:3D (Asp-Asp-Asp) domain-containing protein